MINRYKTIHEALELQRNALSPTTDFNRVLASAEVQELLDMGFELSVNLHAKKQIVHNRYGDQEKFITLSLPYWALDGDPYDIYKVYKRAESLELGENVLVIEIKADGDIITNSDSMSNGTCSAAVATAEKDPWDEYSLRSAFKFCLEVVGDLNENPRYKVSIRRGLLHNEELKAQLKDRFLDAKISDAIDQLW